MQKKSQFRKNIFCEKGNFSTISDAPTHIKNPATAEIYIWVSESQAPLPPPPSLNPLYLIHPPPHPSHPTTLVFFPSSCSSGFYDWRNEPSLLGRVAFGEGGVASPATPKTSLHFLVLHWGKKKKTFGKYKPSSPAPPTVVAHMYLHIDSGKSWVARVNSQGNNLHTFT